jgi:hypothetical protein
MYRQFNDSSAPAAGVSTGNFVLMVFTAIALAAACGLAAYVEGVAFEGRLREAGFLPWSGSSLWDDLIELPLFGNWPSENIFYNYQPGRSLSYVFMYLPALRGLGAGVAMLAAGLAAAQAAWRWPYLALQTRQGLVIASLVGAGVAGAAVIPGSGHRVTLDLSQGTLRSSASLFSHDIQLSNVDHFGQSWHLHHGYGNTYDNVYVDFKQGGFADLVFLNNVTTGRQLADELQAFFTSQGGEL